MKIWKLDLKARLNLKSESESIVNIFVRLFRKIEEAAKKKSEQVI
jgi:hypothetical protein